MDCTVRQEPERWPPASQCLPRGSRGRDKVELALIEIRRTLRNPPTPQMRAAIEQWATNWAGADLTIDETLREAWGELSAIVRRFC